MRVGKEIGKNLPEIVEKGKRKIYLKWPRADAKGKNEILNFGQ